MTQTVDIPADRRITIEVPREVPVGRAQFEFKVIPFVKKEEKPVSETFVSTDEALASAREIITKHRPAFEALAK